MSHTIATVFLPCVKLPLFPLSIYMSVSTYATMRSGACACNAKSLPLSIWGLA